MLKKWTGMVEWTLELLCTVDGTIFIIAHYDLAVVVPFHPVRLQLKPFRAYSGYICHETFSFMM